MTDIATVKRRSLNFTSQDQLKPTWCWAAVGATCALFYDEKSGWTQCNLASASIVPSPGNCCDGTGPAAISCNRTWYIDNGKGLGSFITTGIENGLQKGYISIDELTAQIDKGLVVAYCLTFQQLGMNHFVVISGYDITKPSPTVIVNDSFFGGSEISYDEFVSNYKSEAKVIYTFFTKAK